jgi:hypothetical protein
MESYSAAFRCAVCGLDLSWFCFEDEGGVLYHLGESLSGCKNRKRVGIPTMEIYEPEPSSSSFQDHDISELDS